MTHRQQGWGILSKTVDLPIKYLDVTKITDGSVLWLTTPYGQLRFEAMHNQLLLKSDSYTSEVQQVNAMYAQHCAKRAQTDVPDLDWVASIQGKRRKWERSSKLWLGSVLIVRALGYDSAVVHLGQIASIDRG